MTPKQSHFHSSLSQTPISKYSFEKIITISILEVICLKINQQSSAIAKKINNYPGNRSQSSNSTRNFHTLNQRRQREYLIQ